MFLIWAVQLRLVREHAATYLGSETLVLTSLSAGLREYRTDTVSAS